MQNHVDMYGKDAQEGTTDVKVLYQMPGAPCNDYQGYCDVFYKCRNVDSNGPLSRLTNAILNPELYSNIAAWIQVNIHGSSGKIICLEPAGRFTHKICHRVSKQLRSFSCLDKLPVL